MNKKNLIMLTKQFPFLKKEQYVAHELKYLAEKFDKVYIYPHDFFGKAESPSFELPPNVEIINLNQHIRPAGKLVIVANFLQAFVFEFFRTHNKMWFLKDLRRNFSIFATQLALGNGLNDFLKSKNLNKTNTTFYSYWFSNSALCLAIMKSRAFIDSFAARAHSLDLYHEDWGLLNEVFLIPPFKNFKQQHVGTIYSITDHGKKYLDAKCHGKPHVDVAYLGVDDFGLNPPDRDSDDLIVIATCSGFDENKRLHRLGAALSLLKRKIRWIHFGDGVLRKQAEDSVTSPLVEFVLMGQTNNADIRKYYSEHHIDLFVNVSLVEGLPVTIMEAFSHGIPALATAVNGTPEAVVNGQTGALISVDFSDEELIKALQSLFASPKLQNEMRTNSRKQFEKLFSAQNNYRRFSMELQNKN